MMEISCVEICKQYQVSKAERISSNMDKIQNGLNKTTKLSKDSILLQANEKQEYWAAVLRELESCT